MKALLASVLVAALPLCAQAQAPASKTQPAAKGNTRPESVKKVPPKSRAQAVEEATPLEEPDPKVQLSDDELAIARTVHVGEMACELGGKVTVHALKREGFFLVARGVNRYVMHPVVSRTGALRLEDPARGGLWIQLGNKSMLMNQKEGKRLADECQSPEQAAFAEEMKKRPPVHLLEPAPKTP